MKVKISVVLIFLTFFILGCDFYKGILPLSLIKLEKGVLGVVTNCGIPEGCGPKYRLHNSDFTESVVLLGNINDFDGGLIIEVLGYKTRLPGNQKSMFGKEKDMKAIRVIKYNVLSKIPYHGFLISESQDYMLRRFGCTCNGPYDCKFRHDKSFSWEYQNNNPILKVKWARDSGFAELWYNGNSGEFIKEIVNPPDVIFCSD